MPVMALCASPGMSMTFRQVPDIPAVPPAIDHPAEREVLARDVDLLVARRDRLIDLRRSFASECGDRRAGGLMSRSCQFRQVEIRRDTSKLRTEVLALRERIRRIEEGVLRRRLAGSGNRDREESVAQDRRFELVRDALSAPGDSWQAVLGPFIARAVRAAGDPAFRDAAAYLGGVYQGQLAAMFLDNPYYKHGVRRALAGDDWSAAVAFARAARDHRDDPLIYAAYAAATGRQHASPACTRAGRCVRGNLADWAAGFGKRHRGIAQRLERHAAGSGSSTETRAVVRVLMAVSVYARKAAAPTPEIADIPAKPDQPAFLEIALSYLNAWAVSDKARAEVFARRYDAGGGENKAASLLGYDARPPARLSDAYLEKLRAAFGKGGDENPFAGALDRRQLILLQK